MNWYFKRFIPVLIVVVATSLTYAGAPVAQAGPSACQGSISATAQALNLGYARGFSLFAGAAITNGGPTYLNGYVGVTPGTAITGLATIFTNDSATTTAAEIYKSTTKLALRDLIAANESMTAQSIVALSPISAELGGKTVCPGIYKSTAAFGLTGDLILDGNNNPSSVFIFITPAAITSAAASRVLLRNGAQADNVYWQIGAAATLGASSFFKGTVIAQAAITTGAGAHVHGRLLSKTAAITLDSSCLLVPNIKRTISCTEE
jgi:type VI secretion system secreted protein VgrG